MTHLPAFRCVTLRISVGHTHTVLSWYGYFFRWHNTRPVSNQFVGRFWIKWCLFKILCIHELTKIYLYIYMYLKLKYWYIFISTHLILQNIISLKNKSLQICMHIINMNILNNNNKMYIWIYIWNEYMHIKQIKINYKSLLNEQTYAIPQYMR